MNSNPTAVIIANLGAPSNLDEVRPFLRNLFSDPDIFQFPCGKIGLSFFTWLISTLRSLKSKKYYTLAGGGSPLRELTAKQAEKLQKSLSKCGEFTVYSAQRYWHPFISEVTNIMNTQSFDKIILLPLYPQYSTTSTQSIFNEWNRHADGLVQPVFIRNFYDTPKYINLCANMIRFYLNQFDDYSHLLFTAHSIPVSRVAEGDTYEQEINDQMNKIMLDLDENISFSLCYQGKIGRAKWLGPVFESEVDRLVKKGIQKLVVYPLSFVTENLETLYELDIQKKKYAQDKGIQDYIRIPVQNDSDEFIAVLKDIVLEAAEK